MTGRPALRGLLLGVLCGVVSIPASAQDRPDRTRPPALGPTPQLSVPAIRKTALSNGLQVWLVETHEVPLVQVNLVVLSGSNDDPIGGFGTASLTSEMLDEGAGARSSLEIADAVEFLGATLVTTSSFDASAVRLNVPVARLQDALPMMADVALRPSFPDGDLDRIRQERLTNLLQARDDPRRIAPLAFSRLVFGAEHRYGTGPTGTEDSLATLTAQHLRAFHATFYQPSNSRLLVVGDVLAATVLPQLERHFGAWKDRGVVPGRSLPAAPQLERGQAYLIDKPGAEQSQIRLGWVGVARTTPDYFPLQVLNTILGGSFTSRLNQNLREEHGYAYGAISRFDMRLSPGPFVAAAGVQTDKTAEALAEFFKELNAIAAPVGDDELARAKNYLALGLPGEFETTRDLSARLEELVVYGLPDDYFNRYVANIQAVTVEDVQAAATRYIQPSRFAVVVVGDRETIEPGLRALALGSIRIMSVEEALGP